jgi:hypothetical protein
VTHGWKVTKWVVWTFFKTEQRENLKEGFEHESERKMPKTESEIKLGTAG